MSAENVELVRSWFEAVESDGWKAGAQFSADRIAANFEFVPHTATFDATTFHGADAFEQWRDEMLAAFEEVSPRHEEVRAVGENVVVHGHTLLRGRTSGTTEDFEWWQTFEFRDGMLARVMVFMDEQSALGALD